MSWLDDITSKFSDGPAKPKPSPLTTFPVGMDDLSGLQKAPSVSIYRARPSDSPGEMARDRQSKAVDTAPREKARWEYLADPPSGAPYSDEAFASMRENRIGENQQGTTNIIVGAPGPVREVRPTDNPFTGEKGDPQVATQFSEKLKVNPGSELAYPNQYGRLGEEPSLTERVLATPVGIAYGIGREAKKLVGGTPEPLPKGNIAPGLGVGEAIGALPGALLKAGDKAAAKIDQDGLAKTLGLDGFRTPTWLGGQTEAEHKTWSAEDLAGTAGKAASNAPGELWDIGKGILQLGYHAGEGISDMVNREETPEEVYGAATDIAGQVVQGMGKSLTETVVDPRKSLEDQPVATFMNVSMLKPSGAKIAEAADKKLLVSDAAKTSRIAELESRAKEFTDGPVAKQIGEERQAITRDRAKLAEDRNAFNDDTNVDDLASYVPKTSGSALPAPSTPQPVSDFATREADIAAREGALSLNPYIAAVDDGAAQAAKLTGDAAKLRARLGGGTKATPELRTTPELLAERAQAGTQLADVLAEEKAAYQGMTDAFEAQGAIGERVRKLTAEKAARVAELTKKFEDLKATPGPSQSKIAAAAQRMQAKYDRKLASLQAWVDSASDPAVLAKREAHAQSVLADMQTTLSDALTKLQTKPGVSPKKLARAEGQFQAATEFESKRLTEAKEAQTAANTTTQAAIERRGKAGEAVKAAPKLADTLNKADRALAGRATEAGVLKMVGKAPAAVLTFGAAPALDLATSLGRRMLHTLPMGKPVLDPGYRRWLWMSRNDRLPAEMLALEREAHASATRAAMEYTDALRVTPEKARPLVSEALHQASEFELPPWNNLFGEVRRGPTQFKGGKFEVNAEDLARQTEMAAARTLEARIKLSKAVKTSKEADAASKSLRRGDVLESLDADQRATYADVAVKAAQRELRDATYAENFVASTEARTIEGERLANEYGRGIYEKALADHAEAVRLGVEPSFYGKVKPDELKPGQAAPPVNMGGAPAWPEIYPPEKSKLPWGKKAASKASNIAPLEAAKTLREHAAPGLSRSVVHGRKGFNNEVVEGAIGRATKIAQFRMYEKIAASPALSLDDAGFAKLEDAWKYRTEANSGGRYSGQFSTNVQTGPAADWVKVPDVHNDYGALAGRYVQKDVFYEVMNGVQAAKELGTWFPKMLSRWKASRTVWNPYTHGRNLLTNVFVLAPMVGMNMMDPRTWKHYSAALKDLMLGDASQMYRLAQEHGVFEGGFRSDTPSTLDVNVAHRPKAGTAALADKTGPVPKARAAWLQRMDETFGAALRAAETPGARAVLDPIYGAARLTRAAMGFLDLLISPEEMRSVGNKGLVAEAVRRDPVTKIRLHGQLEGSPEAQIEKAFALGERTPASERITQGVFDDATAATERRVRVDELKKEGLRGWNEATSLPGVLYGLEDELFRQAYFRKLVSDGMAPAEAALKSRAAFIDYENIMGAAQLLRAPMSAVDSPSGRPNPSTRWAYHLTGQSFIAYPVRAVPAVMDWVVKNPVQGLVMLQLTDQLTDLSYYEAGITDPEERKRYESSALRGGDVPLVELYPPARRDDGLIDVANLSFLNPMANYTPEPSTEGTGWTQALQYLSRIRGGDPIGTLFTSIVDNRDARSKQPIATSLDLSESAAQSGMNLLRNTLPAVVANTVETGNPLESLPRFDKSGAVVEQRVLPLKTVDPDVQELTRITRIGADVLYNADEAIKQSLKARKGKIILGSPSSLEWEDLVTYADEFDRQMRPKIPEYLAALKQMPASDVRDMTLSDLESANELSDPVSFMDAVTHTFKLSEQELQEKNAALRQDAMDRMKDTPSQ